MKHSVMRARFATMEEFEAMVDPVPLGVFCIMHHAETGEKMHFRVGDGVHRFNELLDFYSTVQGYGGGM